MIITLLTDFGTADYFAGAMKGVILSRDPRINVVDLSHDIPRHAIEVAAFTLYAVHADFSPGTVHVVVVDPGVGTERAPIAVQASGQYFVGPDNGVFSYVIESAERKGLVSARRIATSELIRSGASTTFHGRDVFAPTAAALATGYDFADLGPVAGNPLRLPSIRSERCNDGIRLGRILHVDRFGNCVTNFTATDLDGDATAFEYEVGGDVVKDVRSFYSGASADLLFVVWGSAGFLEISVDGGSAADRLGAQRGDPVTARPNPH